MNSKTCILGLKNSDKLRAQAKLMSVVSTSPVPKITFIVGNGVGPVSYIMVGIYYKNVYSFYGQ